MSEEVRSQQIPAFKKQRLTAMRIQSDPLTGYSVLAEPLIAPDAEQLESLAILDRLQARLTVMRHTVRTLVPRTDAE